MILLGCVSLSHENRKGGCHLLGLNCFLEIRMEIKNCETKFEFVKNFGFLRPMVFLKDLKSTNFLKIWLLIFFFTKLTKKIK